MFAPYQNELYRLPGSMCGTTDPSTELEETIQNSTAAQLAAADVYSQSMSTSYPSGPYYASDFINVTENRTVGALPAPAADEYHGLVAEFGDMMQTPDDAQLGSAQIPPTPSQSTQASCSWALCYWYDESTSGICGTTLSCKGVPAHFKDMHNIKNLNELLLVGCKWKGCEAKKLGRKNFARHIREHHLKHSRDKGHST